MSDYFLDPNDWANVLNDKDANHALSGEELEALEALRESINGRPRFPAFINGRAGSGKSLILQCVFSDYMRVAAEEWYANPSQFLLPIYLTSTDTLLQSAKLRIKKIRDFAYRLNHGPTGFTEEKLSAFDSNHFDKCFVVFNSLLASLAIKTDPLLHSKRVFRFNEFHQWYSAESNRPVPLHTAWHIIRTYIKGMAIDGNFLSVKDLEAIPEGDLSVSPTDLRNTRAHIFDRYQGFLSENNAIDEQDLSIQALKTLARDTGVEKYGAVACDEAQDFTFVDHQVIARLSAFSAMSLNARDFTNVPMVLAGDPYQTINPTGFDWDKIKEKYFITLNYLFGLKDAVVNFQELTINYRSTPPIVALSNAVLGIRRLMGAKPGAQKSWQMPGRGGWGFYDINTTISGSRTNEVTRIIEQNILQSAGSVHILVNCEPEEKANFVANDAFLSKNVETLTIFTPMEAKGLEFERVILYKFAANDAPLIDQYGAGSKKADISDEYFVNKLYVACTRACETLYLVEAAPFEESFWHRLVQYNADHSLLFLREEFLNKLRAVGFDLCQITANATNWDVGEAAEGVRRRNAAQLIVAARNKGSSIVERKASADNAKKIFKLLQDDNGGKECEAILCELNGRSDEAGKIYFDIGNHQEALRCWWDGKCYQNILLHSEYRSAGDYFPIRKIAEYLVKNVDAAGKGEIEKYFNLVVRFTQKGAERKYSWTPVHSNPDVFRRAIDWLGIYVSGGEDREARHQQAKDWADWLYEGRARVRKEDMPDFVKIFRQIGEWMYKSGGEHLADGLKYLQDILKWEGEVIQERDKAEILALIAEFPESISKYSELGDIYPENLHDYNENAWNVFLAGVAADKDLRKLTGEHVAKLIEIARGLQVRELALQRLFLNNKTLFKTEWFRIVIAKYDGLGSSVQFALKPLCFEALLESKDFIGALRFVDGPKSYAAVLERAVENADSIDTTVKRDLVKAYASTPVGMLSPVSVGQYLEKLCTTKEDLGILAEYYRGLAEKGRIPQENLRSLMLRYGCVVKRLGVDFNSLSETDFKNSYAGVFDRKITSKDVFAKEVKAAEEKKLPVLLSMAEVTLGEFRAKKVPDKRQIRITSGSDLLAIFSREGETLSAQEVDGVLQKEGGGYILNGALWVKPEDSGISIKNGEQQEYLEF